MGAHLPRRETPANALDAYLSRRALTNETFAAIVRGCRRHRTQPDARAVSHWRTGNRRPTHDLQRFVEVASGGEVPIESWGSRRSIA